MTLRTARRLLLGFGAGISAGWLGGLLRAPRDGAPASSTAGTTRSEHRLGDVPRERG